MKDGRIRMPCFTQRGCLFASTDSRIRADSMHSGFSRVSKPVIGSAMRSLIGSVLLLSIASFGCSKPKPEVASDPATGAISAVKQCPRAMPATPPKEEKAAPKDKCPADPEFAAPLKTAPLTIATGGGEASVGGVQLVVELARTEGERQKGLMYRTALADGRGMLFDMGERSDHTFWMRNTCIPLDMIFIDNDGTIVGILEQVPVLNEAFRAVGCPSAHVLEVPAGWSRKAGVRPGQKVALPK